MIWIALTVLSAATVVFLTRAYKRKQFFLSITDMEKYEREKPLFK